MELFLIAILAICLFVANKNIRNLNKRVGELENEHKRADEPVNFKCDAISIKNSGMQVKDAKKDERTNKTGYSNGD